MGEIEHSDKARLREEAWERHMRGESYSSIGRSLDLDRRTVTKYVDEQTKVIAEQVSAQDLFDRTEAEMDEIVRHVKLMMHDASMKPSSMAGPQYLKRWQEVLELRLKMRGVIGASGAAVVQKADTIVNMVTWMNEDMTSKGQTQEQYFADVDDDEVVDAEVVEEDER